MKRAFVSLLLLAACADTPGTDHVDTTDTDVETEVRGDTFQLDPGDTDTTDETDDDSGFLDSDTGLQPDDTAACKLGYLEDCNGRCFPDHFVGDGFCDDGARLPADFDCDAWNHDHGDCTSGDTDTDASAECGRFTLEFHTMYYPNEIGWYIDRVNGTTVVDHEVYKSPAGSYGQTKTYLHDLFLPPGDYQFVGTDSWIPADGWSGAFFDLVDESTGQALVSGGQEMNGPKNYYVWPFTVSCDQPRCTVDMTTVAGADPDESGWQLYTSAGRAVAEQLPGTLGAGTSTTSLDLVRGAYLARLRDLGHDGWEGGRIEARYPAGLLMAAKGLGDGSDASTSFYVDCGDAATHPAEDAPQGTLVPSSCTGAKISFFQHGTDFGDVGWELWRADDWTRAGGRGTGSYTITSNFVDTVNLTTGRYYFQALDSEHDGWEDARLALVGPDDAMLQTFVLPYGSNAGFFLDVLCPEVGPGDTDLDTDVPVQDCEAGATRDCRDICFPAVLIGDGFCDDGTNWSADFACQANDFDGGDCGGTQ
jgi:hypothetical protein